MLLRYSLIVIPPRPHKENFFSPHYCWKLKLFWNTWDEDYTKTRTSSSCSQESSSFEWNSHSRQKYSKIWEISTFFFFFSLQNQKTYLSFLINLDDDDGRRNLHTSQKILSKSSFSRDSWMSFHCSRWWAADLSWDEKNSSHNLHHSS